MDQTSEEGLPLFKEERAAYFSRFFVVVVVVVVDGIAVCKTEKAFCLRVFKCGQKYLGVYGLISSDVWLTQ